MITEIKVNFSNVRNLVDATENLQSAEENEKCKEILIVLSNQLSELKVKP